MVYANNSFSLKLLQEVGQCGENEEQETFSSVTLTKQIACVALGVTAAVCAYRIKTGNSAIEPIHRFYARGMDLGRACYHACQHQHILYIINAKLKSWKQLRDLPREKPQDNFTGCSDIRKSLPPIEPAATKVVADIFARHTAKGSTLELGSNLLDENGNSYLARLLPKEHTSHLIYSDYLPNVAKNESKKTKRPYLCLDATRLHETLPAASKTNVVALNVIDTISRKRLENVVKGIHHVLKENGTMIILCDLPFDQNPLIEKFSTADNFVFPYVDGNDLGIKIISKQAVMLAARPFGEPFFQFIESLTTLPKKTRSKILFLDFAHRLQLCNILERICNPAEVQRIDHKQSYIEDLAKAITAHGGFEIIENGYFKDQEIVQGYLNHPDINVVGRDLRVPKFSYHGFNRNVPKNHVEFQSVFHAVVAKKIK